MCSKWDREWDRCDNMGGNTMDECCRKADRVDPDHEYNYEPNDGVSADDMSYNDALDDDFSGGDDALDDKEFSRRTDEY